MNRRTTVAQLREELAAAGFVNRPCAHRGAHESWEFRPLGGRPGSTLPLYVVHLNSSATTRPVVHGFAYGGPKDSDEHWRGPFTSLSAAAGFAASHGRRSQ